MKLLRITLVLLLALPIMGASGCDCDGDDCNTGWADVNPAAGVTPTDPTTGEDSEYFTGVDGRQYRIDNPLVQKGSPADTLKEATTP